MFYNILVHEEEGEGEREGGEEGEGGGEDGEEKINTFPCHFATNT